MKRFLILGCHRSGTTLVRFVLGAHPDVYCLGEISACQSFAAQAPIEQDVDIVGFQLSSMIEEIPFACPDRLPIIAMERDPVDVLASMRQLNIGGRNMLRDYIVPWVQYREKHNALFYEVFKDEITQWTSMPPESDEYQLKAGVLHHKWTQYLINSYEKLGYPVLRVSYKDLVTDTENITKNICHFLGIQWSEQMLNHHQYKEHTDVSQDGVTIGNNDGSKPIDAQSIGRGYEYFDKRQIEVIQND